MHSEDPDFKMPTPEQVHLAAESLRILSDPTRIKILWALLQGESSVACLAELVDAGPTVVSQHLAKLRLAGLVHGRRAGTFVYYTAADDHVRRLLAEALFHAEHADADASGGLPQGHAHTAGLSALAGLVSTQATPSPSDEASGEASSGRRIGPSVRAAGEPA